MKLLFTMWVTFHIFCFGVLRKNIDKLEVLYVATSLLVPAMIAIVPLTTKTYLHYNTTQIFHSYCYIYSVNYSGDLQIIERFTLWDGPALVILSATSIGMVVMVITIARLLCRKVQYDPTHGTDNYWKALKELLPLAAFPILFFIFKLPELVFDIYVAIIGSPSESSLAVTLLSIALWSLASGITLLIHLSVAKCMCFAKKNIVITFSPTELQYSIYSSLPQ